MTSVFQLYGRPLAASIPLPPLRITGDLEDYTVGESYEDRLQIIDSIGKCVVEIVESSLPPGSYAFVDNFTKEIVLRWPAYAPDAMPSGVPNGDFEKGNDGSWRLGSGWSIEAGGAETGTYSAVYQNQRGSQSIESNRVPYTPGQSITAACRFQQGASSSGNLVGRILLIWCDVNGNMVPGGEGISWTSGTLIRSGSNGEWHTSDVIGASNHPSVATVAVGFSADRKKQNLPCWVDNFTWNHEYSVGTNSNLDFTVTFKVTDSVNRVAYWSGHIVENPPNLYGYFDPSPVVTDTSKIALYDDNLRAVYSTSRDIPGSSVSLTAPILGGGYTDDRVFEWKVNATAGRVYVGSTYSATAGFDPAAGAYLRTGAYVAFLGDGQGMMHGTGAGGFSWISPNVTGRYTDRFAMRVTTRATANSTLITHRFYQNGVLRWTFTEQTVGTSSAHGAFMGVLEGGTTGSYNSFDVSIYTDPNDMLYFTDYSGARGWPAVS